MNRPDVRNSFTVFATLLVLAVVSLGALAARGAMPFNQATVTKVENVVNYNEVKSGRTQKRRAAVADVVRANNYLLTETDSRAELQYEDGSVVRIGQNTVFSFDATTRTLTLDEGSLIFFIPKGTGGQVKTASLTAAITGTSGKVSRNTIAILQGEVTLIPSGRKVGAGFFARRLPDGQIIIRRFDPAKAGEGELMEFNGPLPGFDEDFLLPGRRLALALPDLSHFETLERTQNGPSAQEHFHPFTEPRTRVFVPPPKNDDDGRPPY